MRYLEVLKNKNFRLLWMGQLCSGLGDWIYSIAMLIFIADLKFSGMIISGLLIVRMLPFILIGPLVGNYIDGKKRKKVMFYSDIIRMFLVILVILLAYAKFKNMLSTNVILILIYLIALISAFVGTFFSPARVAIMPKLVKQDELKVVNSFISMSNSITLILGPAFGGILVSLLGLTGVFWLNAATFLFSAICIWRIKFDEKLQKSNKKAEGLIEKYLKVGE